MENSVSALRLLDAVDHPALTVNLQLPLLAEPWEDSVDRLGAYTTHIHIHNWTHGLKPRRTNLPRNRRVPMAAGARAVVETAQSPVVPVH